MENLKYWVWLTTKSYMNPYKVTTLLEHFGDITKIYEADVYEDMEDIGLKEKRELLNKSLENAKKVIEKTEMLGGRIVTFDDPEYPPALKEIQPPPYVLYMKGEHINWEEQLAIGVIGARECTEYGIVAAQKLSYEMASTGILIVSGMARGLDSVAAVSALKAGGKTVAVLGCGLDIVYPPENGELMKAITENGVVITEYPPSCRPYRHNFPQRNRIISGLSRGLLVIEAAKRSGTFTTVEYAKNYGRDIFAVPGGIFREKSEGTNNLIKSGALLITSVRDIFERYPYEASKIKRADGKAVNVKLRKPKEKPKQETKKETPQEVLNISAEDSRYKGLNEQEKKVVELLLKENLHIDELAKRSNMDIKTLNSVLTVLELMGHISKMSGNYYKIII